MFEIFLTIIHVLVCFFLIIVVLLQSGKAADLAGAFGGMGSQTAFGPRGAATMLTKATTTAAVIFMLTSIWIGIETGRSRSGGTGDSVLERTGVGEVVPEAVEPSPAGGGQPAQGGTGSNPFDSIVTEIETVAPAAEGTPAAPAEGGTTPQQE